MSYRVEIQRAALRELADLPASVRQRVTDRIDGLAHNPRLPGTQALVGNLKGLRKLRVGQYRIAYGVNDETRVVTVWCVGHRSTFYRRVTGSPR